MKYNNKFFKTKEEAMSFKRAHGGVIYSYTPRSRTKQAYSIEVAVAYDARREMVSPKRTPYCVAWNEYEPEE